MITTDKKLTLRTKIVGSVISTLIVVFIIEVVAKLVADVDFLNSRSPRSGDRDFF